MYPFGNLPGNLIAFGDHLRREHGFRVVHSDLQDAARALEAVNLSNETAVRHALRPIFSRTPAQSRMFDEAFSAFFFPGPSGVAQPGQPSVEDQASAGMETSETGRRAESRVSAADAGEDEEHESGDRLITPVAAVDRDGLTRATARARYSPFAADAKDAGPIVTRADAAWRDAARALVRRLHLGRSRRWKPASRGRRFDLRRTLRTSLQSGGEALVVRWLGHPRRAPQLVLLIDGSRSMGAHAQTALLIATALASATMRLEVFTFSTKLQRITRDVRRASAGEARHLVDLAQAWAGGTSIGACVREFLRRFGERLIGRNTVVMIVSDGLDVGEPARLREAIRELGSRSAALVWLNPLIDTPGYEPTAGGMAAARPHITTFSSVSDPVGLLRLSRHLRLRV